MTENSSRFFGHRGDIWIRIGYTTIICIHPGRVEAMNPFLRLQRMFDLELHSVFEVNRAVRIGRLEGSEVRLNDPSVSRRHASLRPVGNTWVLVDEGSTNGTFYNDIPVGSSPVVVEDGSMLRFGGVSLSVHDLIAPAPTEAFWNGCEDTRLLLQTLGPQIQLPQRNGEMKFLLPELVDRKYRLFACGCLRRIWKPLYFWQPTVVAVERWADGLATREDVDNALREGLGFVTLTGTPVPGRLRSLTDPMTLCEICTSANRTGAELAARVLRYQDNVPGTADVLRDLFGPLPFREITTEERWLWTQDRAVQHLVEAITQEGRFEDVPILGDALEDAGCTNQEILDHCRSGKEHWRGCWVVDMLRGKHETSPL
jgi:hypothetical protein